MRADGSNRTPTVPPDSAWAKIPQPLYHSVGRPVKSGAGVRGVLHFDALPCRTLAPWATLTVGSVGMMSTGMKGTRSSPGSSCLGSHCTLGHAHDSRCDLALFACLE